MPFLYCGLLASSNIPAFQFLTTRHDASWLSTMMHMFNRDVQMCNGGRSVTVCYLVIDFFALIHAVLWAFNNMDLIEYLCVSYNVLTENVAAQRLRQITFISL